METQYRKLQFEINAKDHDEIWLIGKSANFIFNPNTRNGEELFDFLSCCEEIPDNSHQIQKLEADKAELLEALVKCNKFLYDFKQKNIKDFYKLQSETIFLIQKQNQKY